MGLISFGRNFSMGKPDPAQLALQWYWFEEALWHQHFLDQVGVGLPDFDMPFGDEDLEMTTRINEGFKRALPQYSHLIPNRNALLRSKKVVNWGGGMYRNIYTANPDVNPSLDVAIHIYISNSIEGIASFLDVTSARFGRPVSDSHLFMSQFKNREHAYLSGMPLKYFRLQADAYGANLAYKVPGKREEIRMGFFDYLCTKNPDIACRRLDSGENGFIIPNEIYNCLEGTIKEGRNK